jgi:hypothetical protein
MSEWYKVVRVETIVGIRRSDLDPILTAAGAPAAVLNAVARHTQKEPLHVELVDQGYNATNAPDIVVLDAAAVQVDAALNQSATAVCELATGRDGTAMADGATSDESVGVAHHLERYVRKFVKVRIYERSTVTAVAGAPDGQVGDLNSDPNEWKVLFYGLTNGTTRRGDGKSIRVALHMTHFTSVLGFSSSLSSGVASGTELPYAMNAALFVTQNGAQPSGATLFTSAGFVASSVSGGAALDTDFWGYDAAASGNVPASGGLKRFLRGLAGQDLFDWASFARADLGGAYCSDYGRPNDILGIVVPEPRKNDRALEAIDRIEPFNTAPVNKDVLDALLTGIRRARAGITDDGDTRAVDRRDLNFRARAAYSGAGYRYGVPLSFYLKSAQLGPFSPARSFGADVSAATLSGLAPSSFWDLITARYSTRYQFVMAPMSDRAVVIPFHPFLNGSWQTVYASEVFSWDDDVRDQQPIRGVVLVSDRRSDAGWINSGSAGAASAGTLSTADAAFDSCEDGVFLYRAMPPWLVAANRQPALWAARSGLGPRATAAVPWSTVGAAVDAVNAIITGLPTSVGKTLAESAAELGLTPEALAARSEQSRSTANRLARALYQQARTGPHTVYVTGRYRTDIAPGSVIDLELPGDRYVKAALGGNRDTRVRGLVQRVTFSIDRERQQTVTALQVGFVRLEPELKTGQPLYSDCHPFWDCSCYGLPWCDSLFMRTKLGDGRDINFRPPGL